MRITKRIEIDAGHRLLKHEGKCRNAHGHRYAFEITVEAPALDGCGRVVDFGVIKARAGGWLDDTYDHGFIVQEGDPLLAPLLASGGKVVVVDAPPSIENFVRWVFNGAAIALDGTGVTVVHVRGYETPTSWADYAGEDR